MIEQTITKCRNLKRTRNGLFSFEDFEVVFNGRMAFIKYMQQTVYDRISGYDCVEREDMTWALYEADLILDLEQHGKACIVHHEIQAKHGGRPKKRISTTEILQRKNSGESIASIARSLQVSRDTIYQALKVSENYV